MRNRFGFYTTSVPKINSTAAVVVAVVPGRPVPRNVPGWPSCAKTEPQITQLLYTRKPQSLLPNTLIQRSW